MTIDRTLLTLAAATAFGVSAFAGAHAQGVDKQNPQRIYNEQAVTDGETGTGGAAGQAGSVGAQITLSPADVRLMEQRLNAAGYSVGNVDGVWDAQTQRALQNFQEAQGYTPSGNLNLATISALGLFQGQGQGGIATQQAQTPGGGAGTGVGSGVGAGGDIPANDQRILNESVD